MADADWEEQPLRMQTFHQLIWDVIEPFQRYLAHSDHPTLLVYFGYPQAHEDDTRRAILSAMRLLDALPKHRLEATLRQHCFSYALSHCEAATLSPIGLPLYSLN